MIGRTARTARFLLAAVAAVIVLATPATAQPNTWTVTPGGPFGGTDDAVIMTDSGTQWICDTVTIHGTAKSGSGLTNPLVDFPETPGIQFGDCHGPFGMTVDVTQVGDWHLVCDSYDGDVAYCRIIGVEIDIIGPGCAATISGYLNVTYTNSTGVFRILPDFTLTVSFVDPAANCNGLIVQGQRVAVDAVFVIGGGFTITSP